MNPWPKVPLQHVWLLRAAKFWNNLAGKPAGTVYKLIALDCCTAAVVSSCHNWAWSMFRAIRATGYELGIRVDDMDVIDTSALKQHITQQRNSPGVEEAFQALDVRQKVDDVLVSVGLLGGNPSCIEEHSEGFSLQNVFTTCAHSSGAYARQSRQSAACPRQCAQDLM